MQKQLHNAIKTLQSGGVLLYPTDTIWGIGCDATNVEAIQKINQIKKRDSAKSQLILINDRKMLFDFVENIPDVVWKILDEVKKPLTIIYPQANNLPSDILGADGSIAIRIVQNKFCEELIQQFGKPLTSTSANFSGEVPPKAFSEISKKLKEKVDYIVDHSLEDKTQNKASKILKITLSGKIETIRE